MWNNLFLATPNVIGSLKYDKFLWHDGSQSGFGVAACEIIYLKIF